jgi:hypothetical protein
MKKKEKIITNSKKRKEGTYETDLPNVKNPNDDLFRRIFTKREKAISFFCKYLPVLLLDLIDLDSMEYVDTKHTPEFGVNLYNDLVVKFRLKDRPGCLIIIFEQQTKIDYEMVFRFASYDVAIIREQRSATKQKTIPILKNVVFYTGESAWNASTKFDEYYDDPELGSQFIHIDEVTVKELSKDRDHQDYTDQDLGYCMVAFKCGREGKNAYEEFKKFKEIPTFRDYFNNLPEEDRLLAATYIGLFVGDSMEDLKKVVTLVSINEQENEQFMRTLAQKYQEEGIKQVAINMLSELHLDIDDVQKATKLNRGTIQNLLNDLNLKDKKKTSQIK